MWDKRAAKITVGPGFAEEEYRVQLDIYADDEYSPVTTIYAIPLERINIEFKSSWEKSIIPDDTIALAEIIKLYEAMSGIELQLCPVCAHNYLHPNPNMNALSRNLVKGANEDPVEICSGCGNVEALEDLRISQEKEEKL